MNYQLTLPRKIEEKLLELPENGMGYQVVNFILKKGKIVHNIVILNSSVALLNEEIELEDIEDIELTK